MEEAARVRQAQREAQREEQRRLAQERQETRLLHRPAGVGGVKRKRCGECAGCRADNCGTCANCLDMPKYGGQGTKRQPCKFRVCAGLRSHADETLSTWLQCDRCGKWRLMPDVPAVLPKDDEQWFCEMNVDPRHSSCQVPQQPDDATLDGLDLVPRSKSDEHGARVEGPLGTESTSEADIEGQARVPAPPPPIRYPRVILRFSQ